MNLNNLFIDTLPTLDLHGYDRETARVALDDFIKDSYKMGNVYGIGSGILKETVRETLSKNKLVKNYLLSFENPGCTIVEVRSDLWKNIIIIKWI